MKTAARNRTKKVVAAPKPSRNFRKNQKHARSGHILRVMCGNSNVALARSIAHHLGLELGDMEVSRFSDGEVRVKINESVRGEDVFVVQSTCRPVNENLVELLVIIDALKRASARKIAAVIPYYGYARQDKKVQPREPISARLVANLLETAGVDRVLTMDVHSPAIQGFFNIPVDHLTAIGLLMEDMKKRGLVSRKTLIVSPDVGGVERANHVARSLEVPLAIIAKRRPEPNKSEVVEIIGNVQGKRAIIFDDLVDTAGSITGGAERLFERGATEVHVYATHAVLSDPAIERLRASNVNSLVFTDTIPLPPERQLSKIHTVSAAAILAEAVKRGFEEQSISSLFTKGAPTHA